MDAYTNIGSGVSSVVEGVLDIGAYCLSWFQDKLGFKEASDKTKKWAETDTSSALFNYAANKSPLGKVMYMNYLINKEGLTYEEAEEAYNNLTIEDLTSDETIIEKYSVFGEKTDNLIHTTGYVAGMAMGGYALGGAGNITVSIGNHVLKLPILAGTGGMASGMNEASLKGGSWGEIFAKGFTGGTIEMFTEAMFGFMGIGGNDITEGLIRNVTNKIASPLGKRLVQMGIQGFGEGTEEFVSYLFNHIVDNHIIDKLGDADFSHEWDWKEVWDEFIVAYLSTLMTGGPSIVINQNNVTREAEKQLGRELTQDEKRAVTQMAINHETGADVFYETETENGVITDITEVTGKAIKNPNEKLNIAPAVVNGLNGTYHVIDAYTGALLDDTNYSSPKQAERGFTERIQNADEQSIADINKGLLEVNTALQNKTTDTVSKLVEKLKNIPQNQSNMGVLATSEQIESEIQNEDNQYEELYRKRAKINEQIKELSSKENLTEREQKKLAKLQTKLNQTENDIKLARSQERLGQVYDTVSKEQAPSRNARSLQIKINNLQKKLDNKTIESEEYVQLNQAKLDLQKLLKENPSVNIEKINKEISAENTRDVLLQADSLQNEIDDLQTKLDNKTISGKELVKLRQKRFEFDKLIKSNPDVNFNREQSENNVEQSKNKLVNNTSNNEADTETYIQEMAVNFQNDLTYATMADNYRSTKGQTTSELAEIKEETGASFEEISEVLDDIINGVENNTKLAKVVREKLDSALTNGYKNMYGKTVAYNEEYRKLKGLKTVDEEVSENADSDEDLRVFGMKKENINNSSTDVSKAIDNFKKAKSTANKNDILNIARNINIYHKGETYVDNQILQKSINNPNPKITIIDEYFKNYTDKEDLRKQAYRYALDNLTNKKVSIKDMQENIDMSQKGLKKTFHQNQDNMKMQTANNLLSIVEESTYLNSSINTNNKNMIYHYFISPININGNNELAMITISEDITNRNENNKFYYHDIRRIEDINNNNKENNAQAMPHNKVSNMLFEQYSPSINTSIAQKDETVKSNETSINNKSMQNKQNNTNGGLTKRSTNTNASQSSQKVETDNLSNETTSNMSQNKKMLTSQNNGTNSMKKNGGLTQTQYDSEGRELSYNQAQFFKDSKVRDENGNLKVVYHGTNHKGFYKFNRNYNFFTDNENIANTYTGNNGIYVGYVNIKNPVEIDAHNELWSKVNVNNITINGIDNVKEFLDYYGASTWTEDNALRTSTQDIVSAIYDAIEDKRINADGIIIKNIYDEGAYSKSSKTILGTDYITFNSNQFKNIDNTSPTSNEDIRYMKSSKGKTNTNNTGRTIQGSNNITSETLRKSIDNLRNATTNIDRQDVVNIANGLNIPLKNGAVKVENTDISKKAGKNKKPNLVNITKIFEGVTDSNAANFRQNAIDTAMDLFRDTLVPIKDTYTIAEINKNAIAKTFSGSVTENKVQTADNIREIIEEGIYIYSTQDTSDENAILYHHFFTPVNYNNEKGLIRVVIKEYTKNKTMNDKYYYHQLEYIDNKEIEGSSGTLPRNAEVRHFKPSPSNNIIPQTTENINQDNMNKDDTKITTPTEYGLTNSERANAWIEQEIKKIEETGEWDESIPVTKRSNIRKAIEEYLQTYIKQGHFSQRAYGIYKGGKDIIRTKELKDIDTILHEMGHALDIGGRLNVDKQNISNELLEAVNRLGVYENDSKQVQLEEGFAEIIREYSIVPEQARAEFPQTTAVLEQFRKNDKAFDNFMSNIQKQVYNYIHQSPRNRALSNLSIGEKTNKQVMSKEWLEQEIARNVWDKDYAIKKVVDEMAKKQGKTLNSIKASDNAYYLVRLANGIGDKVVSMLSDGYIDEHGNKIIPGLNSIGEILENDNKRFDDLRAYLVARSDTDYKSKGKKTGLRTSDSQAVINQFKNDTQIQKAAQVVYDTLDGVLQYAVNNGLITQENADTLRKSNVFYVPMHRVLDKNMNTVVKRGAVTDIIKRRTGSELDVKDILENVISNSANIIQQVENNNILKAFYRQGEMTGLTGTVYDVIPAPMQKIGTAKLSTWKQELEKQGVDTSNIDFEKTIDLFAPSNKIDTQHLITSFINGNGKRVYIQFNDELVFNSLMNMDKKFMSQVLKINSKLNMPLRLGATMANISFAIPNMISDTAQAAIYSTAGFIPVVDNAIGVLDILAATNKTARNFLNKVAPEYANRINNLYMLYEQSGSTSSTRLYQYRETSQSVMKDVYGTKNSEVLGIEEKWKPLKRLLDIMTYLPEISEQSTRFRVFERNYQYYLNKGNSEMDARILAALEARDATQDFSRSGNITREINQLIPFSAARVGSAYTFAEKTKANPKQVGMRVAILTAIAMAIKAMGYDDDEIEELNQRKKDDNFVLKIGDTVVTIKKPQGLLRSIINLAEYIQDLVTGHIEEGKEGERLGEWLNNAIMDNMPADSITGLVPNAVAPLIENAMNKDFYYNTDIVKSYDLELPDNMQYYDYNSQLAILLGNVFNYSPAKIDNLISGYFGGLGTQLTNIMDTLMGKMGIIPEKPEMGAEDNAVGKRFVVNVNENSSSVDEVYTRKTELTKKKNGGTITEAEEKELENLTTATSTMATINKKIKNIKASETLTGKEKADEIKKLQRQKVDAARQGLGKDLIYDDTDNTSSAITASQFYPSQSTLSQNNYKLDLTDEMRQEYEQIASEQYKKYESQGVYSEEKLKELKSKCKDYAKRQLMNKYKSQLYKGK